MKILPWTERKWELGLPQWQTPHLLERLEGTPVRLASKLMIYEPIMTVRPAEDKWSILENAGHIWDVESLSLKRFEEFVEGLTDLTPAEMSGQRTRDASYNDKTIHYVINGLTSARQEIIEILRAQDDSFFQRTAIHPRLKQPMTPVDLMYFFAEHDDYHLAIITELGRTLSK